jgi:hypothetical protein
MSASDAAILTLAELRVRSRWLEAFAHNVNSQTGEDGLIAKCFEVVGVAHRWCVDVGAWDGLHGSNTRQLLAAGWQGVQIECEPDRFTALTRLYADNPRVRCLRRFVRTDGPDSLDALLTVAGAPADFDLLCIDIDGNDYHVWATLARHRPRLVVIEYNFTVPDEVSFVQPADPGVAQGCSLRALIELGHRLGYELVFTTGLNAFFVTRDLFPRFGIPDNSIEVMHVPAFDALTHVFFGYDGSVLVRGAARLPWHDLPFPESCVQVLPRTLRKTGGYNRWQRLWFLAVRARLRGDWRSPRKWVTALRVLVTRKPVTNLPGT